MKIGTWNVNGIRARRQQVLEWVRTERPEVLCLQEIKASTTQVPAELCDLEGYHCYWHGERAYSGVALNIRKDAFAETPQFTHPPFDLENRIVTATVGRLVLASVYVPNGGKDFPAKMKFLEALERYVVEAQAAGFDLVLCGDMNVARAEIDVHPKERNPRSIGQRPDEREQFGKILGQGLVDTGRALDPDNAGLFTWWAPWRNLRQRNIGWRLDYVLATPRVAERIRQCPVRADFGTSDHAPVVAVLE